MPIALPPASTGADPKTLAVTPSSSGLLTPRVVEAAVKSRASGRRLSRGESEVRLGLGLGFERLGL